jgi:2-polyprenyl-3-methyl-5-hydroxy-6-metoxy-1,4-benzoquinol methylase
MQKNILEKSLHLIPKGKALDIGAGKGQNSVFLAKNGFEVEAIDKIPKILERCKEFSKKYNLPIKTKVCDVRKFKFKKNKYSLIVARASLDFLKKSEIELIIRKIEKSLISLGFIYFLVFSVKDPMYKKIKKLKLKEFEKNSFYLPKHKTYRHFFTQKELKQMLKNFKIIHLKQKQIIDSGPPKPHFHNIIEIIAQKKRTMA